MLAASLSETRGVHSGVEPALSSCANHPGKGREKKRSILTKAVVDMFAPVHRQIEKQHNYLGR